MKEFTIALAGNPNAGKTTIFNILTGARQHVANYPGVTVEKKEGKYTYKEQTFKIVDLPGTYSLSAYSIEEIISRNFIIENKPDLVIDIVDASNLERNLYLFVQIMELGIPVVLVLNMIDEAQKRGTKINNHSLSSLLNNIDIVETVGNKSVGIDTLKETIYKTCNSNLSSYSPPKIFYGEMINRAIQSLATLIEKSESIPTSYNINWLALKLLENDKEVKETALKYFPPDSELFEKVRLYQEQIESIYDDSTEVIIAEKRYGFISGACTEAVLNTVEFRHDVSDQIDKILTNRFLGIPLFLLLMYLTFKLTFTLGEAPMIWIENFFQFISSIINKFFPNDTNLKLLFTDGIIGGVGSVIIFLPNIIILFLAIGLLEFTGYMARAAFILDKIMHKIGLHGKSFIPMLVGFGCNVPGIIAARTLNTEKERLITILILPLMSCGARLPVYLLIIPCFFPEQFQASVMWLIYLIGILIAIISATILNKFILKGEHSPFIMELPPYRVPTFRAIGIYIWEKSWMYVKKAGTIILAISVILWFFSSYPKNIEIERDFSQKSSIVSYNYNQELNNYSQKLGLSDPSAMERFFEPDIPDNIPDNMKKILSLITNGQLDEAKIINSDISSLLINFKHTKENYLHNIETLKNQLTSLRVQNSYIGKFGKFIEPIFKPIGFDWKITTAIISAIPAKEVFVSQLAIVNGVGEEGNDNLRDKIKRGYSPLTGFCIMLWVLIATPCIATVAAVVQETGSWKWALLQFFGLTVMAYVVTFIVYNIGRFIL